MSNQACSFGGKVDCTLFIFFSLPKQMIFKISRKNWKHEYLMQTSIMEMNDKNIPLQENHLFMVLTPDSVQIVALGGKCFVKLRRVAEMVKLKYKQSSNSI